MEERIGSRYDRRVSYLIIVTKGSLSSGEELISLEWREGRIFVEQLYHTNKIYIRIYITYELK